MATSKIQKPSGDVDKFEETVSQALLEIESAKTDIRTTLRELYITGAKEVDVGAKKAIVVYVPVSQVRGYQKIQVNLVRELEKKFSGKTVVFLGQRRILPKPKKNQRTRQKQLRPRSRTLTAVHDAILDDLVFPAEIVGKRTRVKLDGTKLIKVHLDRSQQTNIEHKVNVFAGVYKHLTGKDVTFEFPVMD
ncbi:small ribosomal subunit protein eS7-like [Dysidea avara]|uniref:small ribosomal subunit protein eS7-like n=1 Tax=Dysidea avara TaxID=196820 RepID=UPI00332B64B3